MFKTELPCPVESYLFRTYTWDTMSVKLLRMCNGLQFATFCHVHCKQFLTTLAYTCVAKLY